MTQALIMGVLFIGLGGFLWAIALSIWTETRVGRTSRPSEQSLEEQKKTGLMESRAKHHTVTA